MKLIRSRCVALLLLCLYGVAATPVTSLAFMSLAMVSAEHEVQVVMDGRGSLEVVLHHHHAYTPCVSDHSGAMDRLLASLCKSDASGDHVFHMSAVAATMEPKISRADTAARVGGEQNASWNKIFQSGIYHLDPLRSWTIARARPHLRTSNEATRPCMGTVVLLV